MRIRKKRRLNTIIAVIIVVAGIVGGLYVGLWMMFVKPIIACCAAFDGGILTALMVGKTVLSCIFAGIVGWGIFYISLLIGKIIA